MGGILPPTFTGGISQWRMVDWLQIQRRSRPAADGLATIELGQLAPDEQWLIDRAVAQCTSTGPTTVRFYDSGIDPLRVSDGSRSGNFDVTEYPNGLLVRPAAQLVAQWVGASAGAVATLTLQVRQFRRA